VLLPAGEDGFRRVRPGRHGYARGVTESPKDLVDEAQRGRSERTPWIALTGVTLVVAVLVGVIVLAALIVYFVV
jgi:hypothetical protein